MKFVTPSKIFLSFSIVLYSSQMLAAIPSNEVDDFMQLSLEDLLNVKISTTSYFDETPLDAGSTVTVINSDYWQKRGARRTDDALMYMPGFVSLPMFLGASQYSIRGISDSNGSGVQTLLDGVPLNAYPVGTAQLDHPNIQLGILDRIEVIRGPGSALYGADAFHGVVSFSAFESQEDVSQFTLRQGSNEYYESAYKGSFEIGSDLRLNVALSGNGQPDQDLAYEYTDSTTSELKEYEREYRYDSSSAVVKIASNPEKSSSFKLGYYYDDYAHRGFFHNGTDVPAEDNGNISSYLAMLKAELQQKFDDKNSLKFEFYRWNYLHQFFRTLPNLSTIFINAAEHQKGFNLIFKSENLLPNSQISMALNHRVEHVDRADRQIVNPAGVTVLDLPLLFNSAERKINSLLLDGKTSFSDVWIVRYGLRLDDYSDFGRQYSPRLGLIRLIDNSHSIKLLYGNSFKAPTGNQLFGAPLIAGNPNLDPESIDTYELAFLTQKENWKAEVVLFQSYWKDAIVAVDTTGDGDSDTVLNLDEIESQGVEITLAGKLIPFLDNWTYDMSGSVVEVKNVTTNTRVNNVPAVLGNFAIQWAGQGGLSILVNNRFHMESDRVPKEGGLPTIPLKKYWRMDLNITKRFSPTWDVFFNYRNLLGRTNEFPADRNDTTAALFNSGIQLEESSADLGFRFSY